VVFGQHIHPILSLLIFSSGGCLKSKVYNSNPQTELKEYTCRETANILA
jgi:hypothetical protein